MSDTCTSCTQVYILKLIHVPVYKLYDYSLSTSKHTFWALVAYINSHVHCISSKHTTGTCNFSTCMFIYSKLTGSLIQMQISLCLLYTYNLCDEKFVTNSQFAFNELWL